jgi:hypothetical protein
LQFELGGKDGNTHPFTEDNDVSRFLNLDDSAKNILVMAKEQELKRKREDDEKAKQRSDENETLRKKVRLEIDSDQGIPVAEWLEYA